MSTWWAGCWVGVRAGRTATETPTSLTVYRSSKDVTRDAWRVVNCAVRIAFRWNPHNDVVVTADGHHLNEHNPGGTPLAGGRKFTPLPLAGRRAAGVRLAAGSGRPGAAGLPSAQVRR